jgi:crossover junction endodeoxyribonuclease RuvC
VKVIGVDPGLRGALAFLNEDGSIYEVEDMPVIGKDVNAQLMSRLIQGYGPIKVAAVESAHSMPKQGITGAFNYGVGYGKVLGVLATLEIPVVFYTSTGWKRHFKLTTDKNLSRRRATERWPQHAFRFSRVKDDGRAEACFIAAKWIADNPEHRPSKHLTPVVEMAD